MPFQSCMPRSALSGLVLIKRPFVGETPDVDGAVVGGRREHGVDFAVPRDGIHSAGVAVQLSQELAGAPVPHVHLRLIGYRPRALPMDTCPTRAIIHCVGPLPYVKHQTLLEGVKGHVQRCRHRV